MTDSELKELVRDARQDRPPPGALSAVARSLRVPFVTLPLAAVVMPSTASAAMLLEAALGRVTLLGWGVGTAVAVSGAGAAVWFSQPAAPPSIAKAPRVVPQVVASVAPPAAVRQEPPTPPVLPNVEKRVVRDGAATWDEPQLIERARRALASDPRRALVLAQEHQRRFPSGALSVEREVIVLDALSRSGQTNEALRRARAFEAKYPQSIHLPRVRALRVRLGDAP